MQVVDGDSKCDDKVAPLVTTDALPHVTDEAMMRTLWTSSDESTSLAYIRENAQRMIRRVVQEDPHTAYIPLRSKSSEVRLFKVATLLAETPLEHDRCDFRGVTRVPGSLETVLELLASEDERESYWVALNTHRGLLVNSLFATRRLEGNQPFPRWNQRYTATKLTKHLPPVECCFSEYTTFYPFDAESEEENRRRPRLASQDTMGSAGDGDGATPPLRRAFVYRRSMDHHLFNMEGVQDKLAKYGEKCERLYLQDYLLEIAETSEPHMCKVVLTCSVYFTDNSSSAGTNNSTDERMSRSMRHEHREFCANVLLSLRQILSNQFVDRMASAGITQSTTLWLSRSLGRRSMPHATRCGVCSSAFTLLKRRHACHACALVICSRCCTKQERAASGAHDLNSRRTTNECILCTQFGPEAGNSRVSVSIRRHFTSTNSALVSARSMARSVSERDDDEQSDVLSESSVGEDEELDEPVVVVHTSDDLDNQVEPPPVMVAKPTGKQIYGRNLRVRAATEDNTITGVWRAEPESEQPSRQTPTQRRFKSRCESMNIPPTASSRGQGVVLLSDIDTLSLTGSFHRLSTASTSTSGSRRGSGESDTGGAAPLHPRASPPFPPTMASVRRPIRSISEDMTLLPRDFSEATTHQPLTEMEDEQDDLANFNLELQEAGAITG